MSGRPNENSDLTPEQKSELSDLYDALYSSATDLADFGADERIGDVEEFGGDIQTMCDALYRRWLA